MVNVVGYIRVSTVNQVKEGYSLGEQLDEIEKYCAANGFNLIHTFSDEGKSGAKTDEDETKIDTANVFGDSEASERPGRKNNFILYGGNQYKREEFYQMAFP